jgi:putative Mn2+ efflux pump MntP
VETLVTPFAIAVIAFSMSADACAAAIARGAVHKPTLPQALKAGLVFGAIETITPILGYGLGLVAASFIAGVDHWIAFALLSVVGAKMIYEALTRQPGEGAPETTDKGRTMTLILTAVGTSIDAAAIGVTLAFLGVNILIVAAAIGLTTFLLATGGMLVGKAVGQKFGSAVEIIGGIGLIAIGTHIVLQHTGLMA